MRITYDPDTDTLFIYWREEGECEEIYPITDDVSIDFDQQALPMAIQIRNTTRTLGVDVTALKIELLMSPRLATAYVEYDSVTQTYSGIVPGISGVHAQGDSLEELRVNLQEVLALVSDDHHDDLPNFVGVLGITIPDKTTEQS